MAWPLSHEKLPVIGRIKPQAVTAAATVTSDIVDMKYWQEVLAVFNMGDYAAGNDGSVVVLVQVGNDSGLSDATTLTGKALTTATFTGSAGDDAVGVIRWRNEEMVLSGTEYRYARLAVTPSDQNLTCSAVLLGVGGRYQPGSDYDLAKVKEIIS